LNLVIFDCNHEMLLSQPWIEIMHGTRPITGKMLIDGKLVESVDGRWLDSINPCDETLLGRVPLGSARDMDLAVDAALRAFPAWAALSMEKRAEYVHHLADAILAKTEEFAQIESLDTGNTIGPMRTDVVTAVSRMRFAAGPGWDQLGKRTSDKDYSQVLQRLKKRPLDYFKDFYADTAVFGSRAATLCGLEFYSEDRVLFASDSPFDPEKGPGYIHDTIKVLQSIEMPLERREKINFRNAQKLFGLNSKVIRQ